MNIVIHDKLFIKYVKHLIKLQSSLFQISAQHFQISCISRHDIYLFNGYTPYSLEIDMGFKIYIIQLELTIEVK